MSNIIFRRMTGFTLIEVLVSMVILALGLLGIASLQAVALKNNQDAYLFSQANAMAYEMSDRIKANKTGWNPSTTTVSIPTATQLAAVTNCVVGCNSAAASCTTAQMAAFDYCNWKQKASTVLLTGATAVITGSPDTGSTTCTGSAPSLCLTMTWSRTNQSMSTAMNLTKFQLEVTP